MVAHTNLTAEDRALTDRTRTRDAGLCGDDDIASNAAVVTDMNEIVEFRAAADPGFLKSPAVNGGVGPYLNIILNDQRTLLRKLAVFPVGSITDVAEAVCSQHGPGVDDHPIAERGAWIDHHSG